VQTRAVWVWPSMVTRALCKFGMKRRFVCTFEWLTLCPYWGPFPQIAQRCAMVLVFFGASPNIAYD
jgi:hypothetical protein